MAKTKVVMVDSSVEKINNKPKEVTLSNSGANYLVGTHIIHASFGTFVFKNGKTIVTPENAIKLKEAGWIL